MIRAALTAGTAVLALAACGGQQAHSASHARPVHLSTLQACQRLRADILRNGGLPDHAALGYVAAHAGSPALASDVGTVMGDHPGSFTFWLDMMPLSGICSGQGVTLPS